MRLARLRTVAAATLLLLATPASAVVQTRAGAAPAAAGPARIVLVGDSITAGATGDWTWRYRLARHLSAVGASVDLVGPHDGLAPFHGGTQEYVDPAFDRDHDAVAGRRWAQVSTSDDASPSAVAGLSPDVVVVMLGVNDLVFGGSGPEDIRDMAAHYVRDLQARDPDVDVVLGELTPIAWADVAPVNALLRTLPGELSTSGSTVVLAPTSEGYSVEDDTFDYVHPAASGEVKIAAAMADALAQLGVGAPAQRPPAAVPQGPRLAPELVAQWGEFSAGVPGVRLTWVPHGADGEYAWVRSGDGPWTRSPDAYPDEQAWLGLDPSLEHDIWLQPVRGRFAAGPDVGSNVVHLPAYTPPAPPSGTDPGTPSPTSAPTPAPAPTTSPTSAPVPPAPTGTTAGPALTPPARVTQLRIASRDRGRVRVRWPAAAGATRYRLESRRSGTRRWLVFDSSERRRAVLGPLLPGRYAVRVVALNDAGRTRGAVRRFRVPSAGGTTR